MIARNDEMNKGRIFEIARAFLRNTKQKQIDNLCLGSNNCSFSFFTDRYYSSTSASVRRNNFRAHAEELFFFAEENWKFNFFPRAIRAIRAIRVILCDVRGQCSMRSATVVSGIEQSLANLSKRFDPIESD